MLGREQEAIEWLQQGLVVNPDAPASYKAMNYRYLAAAYAMNGQSDDARQALAEANRLWPYATVRSQSPDDYTSDAAMAQTRRLQDGLRRAGLRDHASEEADFGINSDGKLHRSVPGYTPVSAPGTTTIRTMELAPLLQQSRLLVVDTVLNFWGRSIPGAVGLRDSGLGGDFSDYRQQRLRRKMLALTDGDMSRPMVVIGWSSERFDSYNLALRLAALGYTGVRWYRGCCEAWEVAGLPEKQLQLQDW